MKRAVLVPIILSIGCGAPEFVPPRIEAEPPLNSLPRQTVRRKIISQPKPAPYPAEARRLNIQGETFVGLVVNENGDVTQVIPYSGQALLVEHTIQFAKSVKFEAGNPTTSDSPTALKIRYGLGGATTVEIMFGTLIKQPNP